MIWGRLRARSSRSRKPRDMLVGALFLGVFVLLALEGWLVARNIAEMRRPPGDNPIWLTTSLEIDRLNLQLALAKSLLPDADRDAAMAQLADALDIYYSRVQTVAASARNPYGQLPMSDRATELIGRLKIEATVLAESFDSGLLADDRQRQETLGALTAVEAQVHELAVLRLTHALSLDLADRKRRENLLWLLMALTGHLVVMLLGLVVFYRRLAWVARRREEQYSAAGALLHRALEAVSEAVIITREGGRIERINRTAEKMFALDREQAPTHSVLGFLPDGVRRFLTAAGRDAPHQIGRCRARLTRANGARFLAAIRSVTDYDARGQRLQIYFVQDLTELLIQRARDRRDRQMDMLEFRRKSSVFAAMTHHLRTPLQIVSGALETISGDDLSAEDREHLDLARHASINAVACVEDIIAAALHRPFSANTERAFDPAGLARSIMSASFAAADKGRCVLLAAGIRPVTGDPHLYATALTRMIEWATESSSELHSVTIRIEPNDGSTLRITVTAQAVSAPQEPSSKVRSAPVEEMRLAVEAMGADLILHEHNTAREISASFSLPLARPVPTPETPTAAALRVLVVDDAPAITRIVARMVERLGHTAEECHSGNEAVSRAAAVRFDVVLLDVSMPGMDGLMAAQNIRACGRSAQARLIILSANLLPEERPRARLLGVERILIKPVTQAELERILSQAPGEPFEEDGALQEALATLTEALGREGLKSLLRELRHELELVAVCDVLEGKVEETARLVHRCAGSAAILGLTDLHAACCAYELALRSGTGKTPAELAQVHALFRDARDHAMILLRDLARTATGSAG